MTRFLTYGMIILVAVACRESRTVIPRITPPPVDGSMLYANEFGALRVIKASYENNRFLNVGVTSFGDVGFGDTLSFSTVFSDLGGVTRHQSGSFDWSYFDDQNPPFATAVLVKRNNSIGSEDHKFQSVYQWVGMNQGQRSQYLFMNSAINGNRRKRLEEFNYWVRARNVKFIDQTSFLVSFTDYWQPGIGKPRPSYIGVDDFVHYIIKYDFRAPDPTIGEVVAGFIEQNFGVMQLYVSGKKGFYILFTPRYNTTGVSPFIMRADNGGFAYTPYLKGNQGYDRAPGHEAVAMDTHPVKDSVIAVVDNVFGATLLQIPKTPEERFDIIGPSLPNSELLPSLPVVEVFNQGAIQMRFNHDGTRIAITSHASSAAPFVAVWHLEENRLVKYAIPAVSGRTFNRIGKPAWDATSPDQRFLYFFATNSGRPDERGSLFYIDTDSDNLSAVAIPWEAIRFSEDLFFDAELIKTTSEIIQKKNKP